jgi:hypothetical protein
MHNVIKMSEWSDQEKVAQKNFCEIYYAYKDIYFKMKRKSRTRF